MSRGVEGVAATRRRDLPRERGRRSAPPASGGTSSLRPGGLLAGRKGPLGAEMHRQDALVLGRVDAGRTQARRLAKRDTLSVKRSLDARVEHFNGEAEASHGVPVGVTADGSVFEAWISICTIEGKVLLRRATRVAEQAAADDRVVVADLRVGPEHGG